MIIGAVLREGAIYQLFLCIEIGTAQSLQAEACKIVPRVEMNPVLLKSGGKNEKGEYLCAVVVLGKQIVRETYGELQKRTSSLRSMVLESHHALAEATGAEVIVIEGAGSCTELNLMERDIVNLPLVRSLSVSSFADNVQTKWIGVFFSQANCTVSVLGCLWQISIVAVYSLKSLVPKCVFLKGIGTCALG
jgi:hypothetical protein